MIRGRGERSGILVPLDRFPFSNSPTFQVLCFPLLLSKTLPPVGQTHPSRPSTSSVFPSREHTLMIVDNHKLVLFSYPYICHGPSEIPMGTPSLPPPSPILPSSIISFSSSSKSDSTSRSTSKTKWMKWICNIFSPSPQTNLFQRSPPPSNRNTQTCFGYRRPFPFHRNDEKCELRGIYFGLFTLGPWPTTLPCFLSQMDDPTPVSFPLLLIHFELVTLSRAENASATWQSSRTTAEISKSARTRSTSGSRSLSQCLFTVLR